MSFQLLHGDCLTLLRDLPENSIDACVTDPPAGIGFMNLEFDSDKGGRDQWIAWLSSVFVEVRRVLKPGAHAFVWAIPRTSHWTAMALEDSGLEVRDCAVHIFGSGFPKSLDVSKAIDRMAGAERPVIGRNPTYRELQHDPSAYNLQRNPNLTAPATDAAKQWDGWGSALKPACEFWWLVRKPLSERNIAANVLKHGTGGLHIDATRIGVTSRGGDIVSSSPQFVQDALQRICAELQTDSIDDTDLLRDADAGDGIVTSGAGCGKTLRHRLFPSGAWCGLNLRTALDSLGDCQFCRRCGDALLHRVEAACQEGIQSLLGVLADIRQEIPEWLRNPYCRCSDHPSNCDAVRLVSACVNVLLDNYTKDIQPSKGRYPPNLLLSHSPDCRPIGTRRVKGCPQTVIQGGKDGGGFDPGSSDGTRHTEFAGYGDAEGMETVEVWECEENCPVRILDEQSGVSTSPDMTTNVRGVGSVLHGSQFGEKGYRLGYSDTGGASRFFPTFRYVPKPSASEKEEGCDHLPTGTLNRTRPDKGENTGLNTDPRWGPVERKNVHPTPKSVALMAWLCRLITPPGGTILDPFSGSGSTGVAAIKEGFSFIGMEQDPQYHAIATARCEHAAKQPRQLSLFDE